MTTTVLVQPGQLADAVRAAQDTPGVVLELAPGEHGGWGKAHLRGVTIRGGGLAILTGSCGLNGSDGVVLDGLIFRTTLNLWSDRDAPMGTITVRGCDFEGSPTVDKGLVAEAIDGPPMPMLTVERSRLRGHGRTSMLLGVARAKITDTIFVDGGNGALGHSLYAVHGCGPVDTHGCVFIGAAGENAANKRGGGKSINDTFAWCGAAIAGKGPGGVDGAIIVHGGVYPGGAGAHAIEWLGEGGSLGIGRCIIANHDGSATGIALDGPYALVRFIGNTIVGGCVTEGRGVWFQGGFRPQVLECGFNRVEVPGGNVWIVSGIHSWRGNGNRLAGVTGELPGGRVSLEVFSAAIGGGNLIGAGPSLDISPAAWLASMGWAGESVRAEFTRRMWEGEAEAYRAWVQGKVGE
jgi:hypothetical protein